MNKKYFFISMTCSLFVLTLIVGFSIVEKNAATIISDQPPVFFSYSNSDNEYKQLKFHFMGKDFMFNF